jgi:branched-subunit amino acid ABC-type transport system permease component
VSFSGFIVQLLNGLAAASSLFLVASGLSLIFGVTRIVNFAHGSFYMLGIYIAYTLVANVAGGLGFWPELLLAAHCRWGDRRTDRSAAAAAHLSRTRVIPAAGDLRLGTGDQRRGASGSGARKNCWDRERLA